jgi:hypothetical protein
MQTISTLIIDDVVTPAMPLPEDAKMIVFNGTEYVIYEDGDELPVGE